MKRLKKVLPAKMDKQFSEECDVVRVIKVGYGSIEDLFDRVFKNENHKSGFELPPTEERGSGNGEDWEVCVEKRELSEYDKQDITAVESGKWPQYCTSNLLTECCNRGIIPEGDYLIDISW